MKKILSIAICSLLFLTSSFAQHTSPRFGTAINQDNTYQKLALGLNILADTAGATPDTLLIIPGVTARGGVYSNHIQLTLKDSCVLAISNITSSYLYDELYVDIENTSGTPHWVQFLGYSGLATKWEMAATGTKISPNSGKTVSLLFKFNGVLWSEVSRCVH